MLSSTPARPHLRLSFWLAALVCSVPRAGVAEALKPGEPLRIGVIVSTTGGLAGVGIPARDGILLAQKTINAKGGIAGHKIELLVEDDASNPDSAVTKVNALVHTQKVKGLIGPSGIAQTMALGAITAPLKLPQVAFSGLGTPIERERTCIFHNLPSQELNARAMLSYARFLKATKVAVMHDSGYGQVVWNVMKPLDKEYGVTFVQVEKFEIGATDVTTQAAKIRAAGPDAVLVMGTSATPFRNLRQVKVEVPIISAHGTSSYDYVKAMGIGADNVIHPEFLIAEDPQPNQKEFVELFKKEYGKLPKHLEATGWDALQAMARAFETAGVDAPNEKVCAAMRRPYAGAMTTFDYSASDMGGLSLSSYTYSKLVKGQFTRLDFKAGGQ